MTADIKHFPKFSPVYKYSGSTHEIETTSSYEKKSAVWRRWHLPSAVSFRISSFAGRKLQQHEYSDISCRNRTVMGWVTQVESPKDTADRRTVALRSQILAASRQSRTHTKSTIYSTQRQNIYLFNLKLWGIYIKIKPTPPPMHLSPSIPNKIGLTFKTS